MHFKRTSRMLTVPSPEFLDVRVDVDAAVVLGIADLRLDGDVGAGTSHSRGTVHYLNVPA